MVITASHIYRFFNNASSLFFRLDGSRLTDGFAQVAPEVVFYGAAIGKAVNAGRSLRANLVTPL